MTSADRPSPGTKRSIKVGRRHVRRNRTAGRGVTGSHTWKERWDHPWTGPFQKTTVKIVSPGSTDPVKIKQSQNLPFRSLSCYTRVQVYLVRRSDRRGPPRRTPRFRSEDVLCPDRPRRQSGRGSSWTFILHRSLWQWFPTRKTERNGWPQEALTGSTCKRKVACGVVIIWVKSFSSS